MSKASVTLALLLTSTLLVNGCAGTTIKNAPDIRGFDDAVHHWKNKNGDDYARYQPEEYVAIADNLLLLQRDNGGWIDNRDPLRKLNTSEIQQTEAEKAQPDFSFDNRNVYTQVAYLFDVYGRTKDDRYRQAALRGLDLILAHQIDSCGGWPHSVPARQSYHPMITLADEVTSGNLHLLRTITERKGPFTQIDENYRLKAETALNKGEDCLLRLQIRQNGKLTGWAGQYDPVTLQPVKGRSFELAAIVSQETVEVVRYLMSIDKPTPEERNAVISAVEWMKASQINGLRLETYTLDEPIRYDFHTAKTDRRLVKDENAPPLWARFYDLNDNSVILANRDGIRVSDYQDIHHERRTGYAWYGEWPAKLITEEYPVWLARHPAN
ncbi:MAG: pectate lyase [Asticcacaulis sp.]